MLKYHGRRPAIHHSHSDSAKVARLALIVNVGDGAFWTIIPIQLAALAGGEGPVGFYLALIAFIGLLASFFAAPTFRRFDKLRIGTGALLAMIGLLVAMTSARSLWVFGALDVPRSIGFLLVTIVLGLLVRDQVSIAELPVAEGRYFLFANLGWLVGPLLAGYVARFYGPEAVFIAVAAVFALALAYLWRLHLTSHPAIQHRGDIDAGHESWRALRGFLSRPRLRTVFVLTLGLEMWWVISAIYIPLAVLDLGFGPDVVGWVVTGGVVPLVALELWVGRRVQHTGLTTYMASGFLIIALGALSFIVLESRAELLLFLFAAVNIGAAFVEPLTDTYFFEVASEREGERYFGLFNAAAPLAGLIGPMLAAAFFTLGLGLNGVWLLSTLLMATFALIAVRLPEPG